MRAEGDESTVIVDATVPACADGGREPTVLFDEPHSPPVSGGASGSAETPVPAGDGHAVTLSSPARDATLVPAVRPDTTGAPAGEEPGAALRPGAVAGSSDRAPVRYVVLGLAGRGGMGTVHVAKDVDLLRRVALKSLAPDAAASPVARARFIREVQVTAQLDHPHVVPVYGLEVAPGDRPAYAMKLVEGRTFADLIAETRPIVESGGAPGEALGLPARIEHFLKVCDAVGYAHERGVVHRDLKPANLMVGAHHEVYVMDWGLCRVVSVPAPDAGDPAGAIDPGTDAAGGATLHGTIAGTPRYMSPEQARGRTDELDARSDQYSLGLILQELVTLRPAIEGTGLAELVERAAEGRRAPVRHASGVPVPAELAAIIDCATAIDRARRYPSVGAFAADLRRFLRGEAVEARPDSTWQKTLRYLARHRQAAGIAVLVFATLCLAAIAGLLWRHDRALANEQFRDRRLQALANDVAEQGDLLQTRLLLLQSAVLGLAGAFEEAAEHGRPSPDRGAWYGDPSTEGPGAAVGVFVPLGREGRTVAMEAAARQVQPVTARSRRWLADARRLLGREGSANDPAGEASWLPVMRIMAVFDAGFAFVAPLPAAPSADARREPWFARSRESAGTALATIAAAGDGVSIVIGTALRRDVGEPIGALGVSVSAGDLLARLAERWSIGSAWAALIIDVDRRVLAVHPADAARPGGEAASLLADARFAAALAARDVGFVELERPGGAAVLAFDRIHPFEWSLVVAVTADRLFDRR